MAAQPRLERRLGFLLVLFYGLGTTVGAGIYALPGAIAAKVGYRAPLAFVLAALLATCSAFSFAELSARFPVSAGEARYVREAFGSRALPLLVGLGVATGGIVSAAALSTAFAGYLRELTGLPATPLIVALVLALCALAAWGIKESVVAATAITLIELGGLLLIVVVGGDRLAELPARAAEMAPPGLGDGLAWLTLLGAAVIAFYAFLGFEDMVNVAEEVIDVERNLPAAILATLVLTTVVYAAVATVAILVVPPAELAASEAPLATVYVAATGGSPALIGAISVIALLNGVLVQIVMAARLLYGLARQDALPALFGRVHPRRHTPVVATVVASAVVLVLALLFPLAALARVTALVTLAVFAVVNLSLVRVKRRDGTVAGVPNYPMWLPVSGAAVSAGVLVIALAERLA